MLVSDWISYVCSSDLLHLSVGDRDIDTILRSPTAHLPVAERVERGPAQLIVADHLAASFPAFAIIRAPVRHMDHAIAELAAVHGPRIAAHDHRDCRSEEHTSELQSPMRISYAV